MTDAVVDASLPAPGISHRDVVLVTGPWLAGTTSVLGALRDRLADRGFVESDELRAGDAPVVVVFVVSAAAPLTDSDCALLDAAAESTDAVVCVVAKIDVHRTWRDVLERNRAVLAAHASRYADVSWVGVAAAPDLGAPNVDDLVLAIGATLTEPTLERRNRLRAWHSHLRAMGRRYESEVACAGREARLAGLRERRSAALRQRRLDQAERTIALRSQVQQARVQLSYVARNRCTSVRTELQQDAAAITRRTLGGFAGHVRQRMAAVVGEVDDGISTHLTGVADGLDASAADMPAPPLPPVEISEPPLRSRRLEARLMTLLGAGFGLGVALTLSRLLADLAPGWTLAGAIICAVIGVALTLWVVSTRGLLHDRAVLDRWVAEVTAALRTTLEERVATRVLVAESAFSSAVAERDAAESARVEGEVADIDRQIREHAAGRARAILTRDRELPAISRAQATLSAELDAATAPGRRNRPDEAF